MENFSQTQIEDEIARLTAIENYNYILEKDGYSNKNLENLIKKKRASCVMKLFREHLLESDEIQVIDGNP